jgi:hypothetical protein
VTLPGASGPVTQVAAGQSHSLAVTSTGQLYAFGQNFLGQLGSLVNSGTNNANPTPMLVTLPGATGSVTQIAAGQSHSLAVTSSGQLYAFGYNYFGQLGSETNIGVGGANPTPALVALPAGTTIDTVARGNGNHTLALVADLAVTSESLPAGRVGVPYSASAQASGGTPPYILAALGLPAGLTINPASGQITGTPTTPGSSNVTLTVTDAYGISASSAGIPLNIAPVPSPPPPTPPPTPLQRVTARMTWAFGVARRYTIVESLIAYAVPRGGYVEVSCKGRGCPFSNRRSATVARKRCHVHKCHKRPTRQGPEVNLTALFKRRHLRVGARISVRLLKTGWIGESYVFTMRSNRIPNVSVACLAPGSSVPGRGC